MKRSCVTTSGLVLLVIAASLVPARNRAAAQQAFTLSSPAFASGTKIPTAYTCSGQDKSPALVWSNLPKATRSVALIVSDPDAPMGTFVHWVIYDISATRNGLPESVRKVGIVAGIGTQGINSTGQLGYKGPCPPSGPPHHYHFLLRALDFVTQAKPGLSASALERLIRGHVLASTEIVGIYQR
jgi:Raf kinase inhibitor-like YbhB/YbcL family protein